mmetsp:Transcript_17540/g.41277  ORF Transcript_17540/g.41277 Transcript_17540/m.41277 type:complete len:229 (-) Transcript_17540:595-1281(-)
MLVDKGRGHRHGLRDSGALDEEVVKTLFSRQLGDVLNQVLSQRAANASILHLDHLVLASQNLGAGLHKHGIDVDLGHVVDNDSHAMPILVLKHVREQRGLPSSKEATQHSYRQLPFRGLLIACVRHFLVFRFLLFWEVQDHELFELVLRDVVDGDQEPRRISALAGRVGRTVQDGPLREPATLHDRYVTCVCGDLTSRYPPIPFLDEAVGHLGAGVRVLCQGRDDALA